MSPREPLDLLPHPREVREGQAPHGRDSGPQAGRSRFPLRLEEDVGFVRVNEFKAKIDVARRWTCSRSASACPGSSSTPVPSEKLVTDNVVSRLKSNRAQGLPRTPSRRGTSQWDTPGVYYADLTLGGRVVMVKLLVRERKRDSSGTHVRYLYTTDLSLSEEEACLAGDRGAPQRRQGPGTRPSGGGRGFRVTSRPSPSTTSSGS